MVSVHPARRARCHDVAELPKVCLFISPVYLFWGKILLFFQEYCYGVFFSVGYASS